MNGAGPIYETVLSEINIHEPVACVRKDIADFRKTYHIYTTIQTTTAKYPKFAGARAQRAEIFMLSIL
jgi:hypothetical protein